MIIIILKLPLIKLEQSKNYLIFCKIYAPDADRKQRLSLVLLKIRFID